MNSGGNRIPIDGRKEAVGLEFINIRAVRRDDVQNLVSHITECQYSQGLARKANGRPRTAPALIARVRTRLSRQARGEVKSTLGEVYTETASARREAQMGPASRRIVNMFS